MLYKYLVLTMVILLTACNVPTEPVTAMVKPNVITNRNEEGFVPCRMIPVSYTFPDGTIEIIYVC